MIDAPPDGTRFVAPSAARARSGVVTRLAALYDAWGYLPVEVPVLERYAPEHPRASQSFKLSDRDSGVLALRSDFTPAVARLVRSGLGELETAGADARAGLRLQYAGKVWHAIDPELARTREFTQIGLELVGVSNARADAELIHLARESVRTVGLSPRVEVGNPGFVRALFDEVAIPAAARADVADAIDRKDRTEVRSRARALGIAGAGADALEGVCDLYGDVSVLHEARRMAPWDGTSREIARLMDVIDQFEDASELLVDLGMARRLSYYTGVTFRAYTFDFGQPLLGGGRYDGALLPYAAGFSIGLERLMDAMPGPLPAVRATVVSLDDEGARRLRRAGVSVVRALSADADGARAEARELGALWLLHRDLTYLGPGDAPQAELAGMEAALADASEDGADRDADGAGAGTGAGTDSGADAHWVEPAR